MNQKVKDQIKKAPQSPGVYIFKNKRLILYVGKAVNLRKRVSQYLNPVRGREGSQRASASNGVNKKTYSPFLSHILDEAKSLEFKKTDSEIEALILESRLIKELKPKYNIMLRDDKQYFYIGITKEEFPKILITHQPFRATGALAPSDYIGPFTDGSALKTTLRLLRRAFPYCTCKQKHNNFCLNYHIGNCPGFCCSRFALREAQLANRGSSISQPNSKGIWEKSGLKNIKNTYRRNIKTIKDILSGKKAAAIRNLKRELNELGKKQEFEEAIKLRDKLKKLEKIFANAKIIQATKSENEIKTALEKLAEMFRLPRPPRRIEGYDVSNIQGKNAVGAMVVFADGRPDKNEYRKFKIRFKKTPDDTAMLKEILRRRFNHPEWPFPNLILIDGGIAQLNVAKRLVLKLQNISKKRSLFTNIPVISLAKGKNEVFSTTLKKPVPLKKLPSEIQNLIKYIDSEAHRFAIAYYRKIHRKMII